MGKPTHPDRMLSSACALACHATLQDLVIEPTPRDESVPALTLSGAPALAARLLRTRWLVRAPVWLYRARLGSMFGSRLLMLEHTGRKTGIRRYVVLEAVDHPDPRTYIVAARLRRPRPVAPQRPRQPPRPRLCRLPPPNVRHGPPADQRGGSRGTHGLRAQAPAGMGGVEAGLRSHPGRADRRDGVSIHGVPVNWCQAIAGSGGSQGFPAMALLMASSAVMPWAAAVSR